MRTDEFLVRAESALNKGNAEAAQMGVRVWGGMGLVRDDEALDLLIVGRWLNMAVEPRKATSEYAAIALSKMAEAARYSGQTPLVDPETHHGAYGYKGGGRTGQVVFGVSGTSAEDDLKIGLAMYDTFCVGQPVMVHHVGFRVTTRRQFDNVTAKLRQLGLHEVRADASDHLRAYFQIGPDTYFEVQHFPPDASMATATHLDIVVSNPVESLAPVGPVKSLGEGEPKALAWFSDVDVFGVMARTIEGGLWVPGQ